MIRQGQTELDRRRSLRDPEKNLGAPKADRLSIASRRNRKKWKDSFLVFLPASQLVLTSHNNPRWTQSFMPHKPT
jgi:hypothetical protein